MSAALPTACLSPPRGRKKPASRSSANPGNQRCKKSVLRMRAFVSLRFSWLSQERFEAVPIGRQTGNPDDVVDAPRSAAAGDVDDDVDRLCDQRPRYGNRRFEDQLFEPDQRTLRRAGVDGGNTA